MITPVCIYPSKHRHVPTYDHAPSLAHLPLHLPAGFFAAAASGSAQSPPSHAQPRQLFTWASVWWCVRACIGVRFSYNIYCCRGQRNNQTFLSTRGVHSLRRSHLMDTYITITIYSHIQLFQREYAAATFFSQKMDACIHHIHCIQFCKWEHTPATLTSIL